MARAVATMDLKELVLEGSTTTFDGAEVDGCERLRLRALPLPNHSG